MGIEASIPKLISAKVLRELENNLVAKQICNMDPQAPIKKEGDTVYFPGLADPTINTYSGSITYENLQDSSVALLIDQKKYYAFKVDDIESFQSTIDLKSSQTTRAAYELANVADQFVFSKFGDAYNTHTDSSVDTATVLSTTSTTLRKLEEQNVKANQMWMVVPPWYAEKLRLAGVKFQINNGGNIGDGLKWADYLGAKIYVSNNLNQTGSEGSYVTKIMAGSYNAIVYADQILKTRFISELEGSFAGGASGLHVYGARTIKSKELVTLTATQTAETAI